MKYFLCLLVNCSFIFSGFAQAAEKPNIILIMFDDLNDWVEGYGGHPQTSTPSFNEIASYGTTFLNAFCSAPVCAPSRTSFLTGKNPTYTGVYNNEQYNEDEFRINFPPEKYIITLPEHLKDNAGYFTFSIDKIFHADQKLPDYDSDAVDDCSRSLSWSHATSIGNSGGIIGIGNDAGQSVESFEWAKIDEEYTSDMQDYAGADFAMDFLNNYNASPGEYCNKPFFLALGFHKPHLQLYIPEQFFLPYYVDNFSAEPFNFPYNTPANAYPYNGVVLAPQPPVPYQDYENLGYMGKSHASPGLHDNFIEWAKELEDKPVINDSLTDMEKIKILTNSKMANATMAYLAAIKFVDEQLGRFWNTLEANPEIFNNTVVILASDHGYSLDEKQHWKKNALWETDIRIPFIIVDLRNINHQVTSVPVSLLDLYPTICDYAMVDPPLFPDSSNYLEGKDIRALAENAALIYEAPQLTTYKNELLKEASCMEQFSVTNGRFHYIQYHSNNLEGILECDSSKSFVEEELYEIGELRDMDVNEWNNLGNDINYQPLKNYLSQWLPGHPMFTKKTIKPFIKSQPLPCFATAMDTLKLSFDLYDTTGILTDAPANYKYVWTNNLSSDTLIGTSITFPIQILGDIPANQPLIFYLQITDTINNTINGFDMKTIYLNNSPMPSVAFSVDVNNNSTVATIDNILITGDYNKIWWDFGNGHIYYGPDPGPYVYPEYGTYTITCYIEYGNSDVCKVSSSREVTTINFDFEDKNSLFIYPNPTSSIVNIATQTLIVNGRLDITDVTGQLIYSLQLENNFKLITPIDVSRFTTGIYFVTIATDSQLFSDRLVIF